jgi:hypothetical protein
VAEIGVDLRIQELRKNSDKGKKRKPWYTLRYQFIFGTAAVNFSSGRKNFKNGIMLPKFFWPTGRKNCSSDREKFLKFEAEVQEFAKKIEITKTICSNSERSEQLEFKLEKHIGSLKQAGKDRKKNFLNEAWSLTFFEHFRPMLDKLDKSLFGNIQG